MELANNSASGIRNSVSTVITFLAGASITLSLAPFHLWYLLYPCLAVLIWQLDTANSVKQSFIRAWNFGFGLNLASVCWVFVSINYHSNTPFLIALFLTILFCGFLGLLYGLAGLLFAKLYYQPEITTALITEAENDPINKKVADRSNIKLCIIQKMSLLFLFPAVITLQEFLKTWLFTGFPWPFLGYGQIDSWLAGFAPVLGVNGITFICCLIAVLTYWLFITFFSTKNKAEADIYNNPASYPLLFKQISCISAIIAATFAAGYTLQQIEWTKSTGTKTSVSLVQANIPQEKKWLPQFFPETLMRYRTLSQLEWNKQGLVIWPESAFPKLYVQVADILDDLEQQAIKNKAGFITGVLTHQTNDAGESNYYNSVLALGEANGIYHKRHLVPFGEVVPFETILKPLGSIFSLPMSSFSRGDDAQQPLLFKGIRFSPYICYEIIYPQYVIRDIEQTDVLLTISNDTWFGKSHGPWQHIQMAQMRAAESGRYLVRSNNNGFSMITNHKGKILKLSKSFKQDVLSGEVEVMRGYTPFMKWGQWPVFGSCLFSVLAMTCLKVFFSKEKPFA